MSLTTDGLYSSRGVSFSLNKAVTPSWFLYAASGSTRTVNFPTFNPERRIKRHFYRRTFCTPWRSLSFGWPTIGVKALMTASNLVAMLDDEVIVCLGGLLTVD